MNYQPLWQGGQTVGPQERDCAGRYAAILPFVPEGARVLDFGAFTGYFSHRLADERSATCVAVSPQALDYPGVTAIKQDLSADGIRALGKFDVVLALSVLHHVRPWRDYWTALLEAAPTVIVEVPHRDETFNHCPDRQVKELAEEVTGTVLCETAGYQTGLLRATMLAAGTLPVTEVPGG